MYSLRLVTSLVFALALSHLSAQQGDKKDPSTQVDPIPADQIPPSPWLNDEQALESFEIQPGFEIELVAGGEHVFKAVALSFDADGRMWTVEMRNYMNDLDGTDELAPTGVIRVLEDADGDGVVDQSTIFMEGLVLPRAIAVTSDGCLFTDGDALKFVKRDGLRPVGVVEMVDEKYAEGGNPEHKSNGLMRGIDNWYYNAKDNRRYRRVDGKWLNEATNSRGQWGIAQDDFGRLYYTTNSVFLIGDQFAPNFYRGMVDFKTDYNMGSGLGSNGVWPIHMTPGANRAYQPDTLRRDGTLASATAVAGATIYRGDQFPDEYRGMAFSTESVADLVKAIDVDRDEHGVASGKHVYEREEFLASTDEWFTPVSIYNAPDGSLVLIDMVQGLVQHKTYMTSYLRGQYASRDLDKPQSPTGRIYRIRSTERELSPVMKLGAAPTDQLLAYLMHQNGYYRDTAQRLLVERQSLEVVPMLEAVLSDCSVLDPAVVAQMLWTLEGLGASSVESIVAVLGHPSFEAQNVALQIAALQGWKSEDLTEAIVAMDSVPETAHARIRALAGNGAFEAAQEVLVGSKDHRGLALAFVSGLGLSGEELQSSSVADAGLKALLDLAHAGPKAAVDRSSQSKELTESVARGEGLYVGSMACAGCHGLDGMGVPNMAPPLNESEWVTGDAARLGHVLLRGLQGPISVNGKDYKAPDIMPLMPGFAVRTDLTDQDYADVINYVRNSWDNEADYVAPALIERARKDEAENLYVPLTAADIADQ